MAAGPMFTRSIFLAVAIGVTLLCPSLFADTLAITKSGQSSYTLTLKGVPVKDYRLEWTDDLASGAWTSLGIATTNGAGVLVSGDNPDASVVRRFYRGVLLPDLVPAESAAGNQDGSAIILTLGGSDPADPGAALQAIVSTLPSNGGSLFQMDGTPITAAGAVVTDSLNRVRYVPKGADGGEVGYQLRRGSSGALSAEKTVSFYLKLSAVRVAVPENQATIFQLGATDPSPIANDSPYTITIPLPPQRGRLYQVADDDVTQGAVFLSTNMTVTNPRGYVMYVPEHDKWGSGYETFTVMITDRFGLRSNQVADAIDIAHVNQAPTATAKTFLGVNDQPITNIILEFADVDNDPLQLYFTQLPAKGKLYVGNLSAPDPSKLVATGQPYPAGAGAGHDYTFFLDQPYDYGSPYAQLSFYVADPNGLTSQTVQCPINIQYKNTPPVSTTPGSFTLAEDAQDTLIQFSATDQDGDEPDFQLATLTTHGALYYNNQNINALVASGQVTLPVDLPGSAPALLYIPDGNYNGTDSFTYFVQDPKDRRPDQTINLTITPVNDPPVISGQTTVTVVRDGSGAVTQDAQIDTLTISDDAAESGAKVYLLIQAVGDTGADASLYVTSSHGVTVTHPDASSIKLEAGPGTLTTFIGRSHIFYHPSATHPASTLAVTVNDEGNYGSGGVLSATANIAVSYTQSP